MTGAFRHEIGDALYDLHDLEQPLREGGEYQMTVMHTIVKRTERFVYVHDMCDRPGRVWPGRLCRLSVADLERQGYAFSRAHHLMLHTRPMPHWPLLVLSCEPGNVLEAAP